MTAPALPDLPPLPAKYNARGADPTLLHSELLHIIGKRIASHPRSQQLTLGPSEIGTPCNRRLAYKMLRTPEANSRGDGWRPTVGTAVHTWLEAALQAYNDEHAVERFYLEERVDVGEVQGKAITGKCDVYDRFTATTVDWKIVGQTAIKRYRKAGEPGAQYRAQAHLYGRGFARAGLPIDHVAVLFLPNSDELTGSYYWTEPYDESIALAALAKTNGVADLVTALGATALPIIPTADAFCAYCPYHVPAVTELTEACPGHHTPQSSYGLPPLPQAPAA